MILFIRVILVFGFSQYNTIIKLKIFISKHSTIYHISSKIIYANFPHDGFIMHGYDVNICKQYFIPPIPDSMVPNGFCQNNKYVITFTTSEMVSKFWVFSNQKLHTLYITESIRT